MGCGACDSGYALYVALLLALALVTCLVDAILLGAIVLGLENERHEDSDFEAFNVIMFLLGVAVHAFVFVETGLGLCTDSPSVLTLFLRKCFKVHADRGKVLLLLCLLLPLNILWLFGDVGEPVYNLEVLGSYNIDALMATWPEGGGLTVNEASWRVYDTQTNQELVLPSGINSHSCYRPQSHEFQILQKLRSKAAGTDDERPKQGYCVSSIGDALESIMSDDLSEEIFTCSVLLYAALTGFVARKCAESENGGFLEDIFDVFEMYMFTFVDTQQLIEGRKTMREDKHRAYDWLHMFIWIGYGAILLRAFLLIGWESKTNDPIYNIKRLLIRLHLATEETEEMDISARVGCVISSLSIELPFLVLRCFFLVDTDYLVPVSVLVIKNVFCLCRDAQVVFFGAIDVDLLGNNPEYVEDEEEVEVEARAPTPTKPETPGGARFRRKPTTMCRYGSHCYNMNPEHRRRFYHPPEEEDGRDRNRPRRQPKGHSEGGTTTV